MANVCLSLFFNDIRIYADATMSTAEMYDSGSRLRERTISAGILLPSYMQLAVEEKKIGFHIDHYIEPKNIVMII